MVLLVYCHLGGWVEVPLMYFNVDVVRAPLGMVVLVVGQRLPTVNRSTCSTNPCATNYLAPSGMAGWTPPVA